MLITSLLQAMVMLVDKHEFMQRLSSHLFFAFAQKFQLPKIQIAALVLIINEHLLVHVF